MSRRASLLWAAIGVVIALGTAFSDLISFDRIPIYRDLLLHYAPFRYFLVAELRAGRLPLWNPYIYLGTPFLGSLQAGVFYPPHLLLLLPFPLSLNVLLLAHLCIAASGFFVLLRDKDLSLAAAAIGALSFTLGGYLVSTISLTNHFQSAVWVPWVILAWDRYRSRPSFRRVAIIAVLVTIEMLGGAPEVAALTIAILFASAAAHSAHSWLDAARRIAAVVAIAVLVAVLAAFQILPTIEYLGQTVRASGLPLSESGHWSVEPISLLQWILPHSSFLVGPGEDNTLGQMLERHPAFLQSIYLGVVPLCLAVVGFFSGRERGLWLTVFGSALVLSLGSHGGVLPWLSSAAPALFGIFRFPEKFYFAVQVAVTMAAAEGMEKTVAGDKRAVRVAVIVAVCLIVVAIVLLTGIAYGRDTLLAFFAKIAGAPITDNGLLAADLARKARRLLVIAGTFLLLLAIRRRFSSPALFPVLMVVLAYVDLAAVHYRLNLSLSWSELRQTPLLVDAANLSQANERIFHYQTVLGGWNPEGRVPVRGLEAWEDLYYPPLDYLEYARTSWSAIAFDQGMFHGVGTVGGLDGFKRRSSQWLLSTLHDLSRDQAVELLRRLGITRLIGPVPIEVKGLEPEPRGGSPLYVYRVATPVPFAYLVPSARYVPSDTAAVDAMLAPDADPRCEAVTAERLSVTATSDANRCASPGEVAVESRDADRIVLHVRADRRAVLVLNESYYPGWWARIDGLDTPIIRTNVLVRGVAIDSGDHRVEFLYAPRSFRIGAAVTLAGLIFVSTLATFSGREARE